MWGGPENPGGLLHREGLDILAPQFLSDPWSQAPSHMVTNESLLLAERVTAHIPPDMMLTVRGVLCFNLTKMD